MIKIQSTPITPTPKHDTELRKVAEAFEAVILRQMMASMRKAKLGDEMFGSSATDNFREMADAKLADNIAEMRQFGIADLVEKQLAGITKPFASSPSTSSGFEKPIRSTLTTGVSTSLDTNGEVK
jgi:peptidoglycan hydrolase FlgJ